jgi:tRNA (guanine-N7-)-methyltransferase
MTLKEPHFIRSFVCREGRITTSQAKAWAESWSLYGLTLEEPGVLDLDLVFGRSAGRVLEIGFGDGQSLLETAYSAPNKDFIGIEVYRSGIGRLMDGLRKRGMTNVKLFSADAVAVLKEKIRDASLECVQIFFSDPWPKRRHHKRRLIQTPFVDLIAQKLRPGGRLHLATDWENYAEHMMAVISKIPQFQNEAGAGQFSLRPASRPITKYEKKALKLGATIWDLIFKRVGPVAEEH